MTVTPSLVNEAEVKPDVAAPVVEAPKVDAAVPPVTEPVAEVVPPKTEEPKTEIAKTGAPEKYENFKLPEGFVADAKMLESFSATAKELGLSQEAAQKLIDFNALNAKGQSEAAAAENLKALEGMKAETIKLLGPEYKVELGFAARALDKFGTPELRKLLDETGFGNHPEVVKMLVNAGKKISEDGLADGKSGALGDKSAAEILYPNTK